MDTWLLIPCQKSRIDQLRQCLISLEHNPDRVVIVATEPNPIEEFDIKELASHVVYFSSEEINIAKWWNLGLHRIKGWACTQHEVCLISSDHIGRNYSISKLGVFLREYNLTMVGPNYWNNDVKVYKPGMPRGAQSRVPGCCMMLAGESNLRLDENLRWWYSDDDLEMQARHVNGTGIIPFTGLIGGPDTPLSEIKTQWSIEDRQKFIQKWGVAPW